MRRLRSFLPASVDLHYSSTGVPRIRTPSVQDAFTALGVLHAWDRATQLSLSHLAATGTLCEHLGYRSRLLQMDRMARALAFSRPDPRKDSCVSRGHELTTAYLDGVNRVFRTGRIPLSQRLSGVPLPEWNDQAMAGLVRFTSYTLSHTQGVQEMAILKAVATGPDYLHAWEQVLPGAFSDFDARILDGLTIQDAPYTVLETPVSRDGKELRHRESSGGAHAPASNNWAVSAARTASGGVIVCNDPHLAVNRLPNFWYQAEIITPDLYVLGFTVPGTPAFIGGWNGEVAWGITHAATDSEDLVVEECQNGSARRAHGRSPVSARDETIVIRNSGREVIRIHELDGGVIHGNPDVAGRYVRTIWGGANSCTGITLNAMVDLLSAKRVSEAADAARRVEAVDLNWVFGDRHGDIGYQLSGSPLAHGTEGAGIRPRAGWAADFQEPRVAAPASLTRGIGSPDGIIVTANQRIRIDDQLSFQSLPFASDRADRIKQLLAEMPSCTVRSMQEVQYDVRSLQAQRVLAACRNALPEEAQPLLDWDCSFDSGSREATLYHRFNRCLLREVVADRFVPAGRVEELLTEGLVELASHHLFERLYGAGNGLFHEQEWRGLVRRAFRKAQRQPGGKLPESSEPQRHRRVRLPRRWGRANRLVMRHQLLGHTLLGHLVNDGPHDYRGHSSTVFQGLGYNLGRASEQTTGPTYHLIVDFGENAAYTNMAGGRTERALHRHYRLGIASWLTARYERFVHPSEDDFQ